MRIPIPCSNHESLDPSDDMEEIVRNMGGVGVNRDVEAEIEVRVDENDDDHNEHLLAAGYTPLDDIDDLDFNELYNDPNEDGEGVYMFHGGMFTFADNNESINLHPESEVVGNREPSGWVDFDNTPFQNTSQIQVANDGNDCDTTDLQGNYLDIADQALSMLENDYKNTRSQDPNDSKSMTQTTNDSNEKIESSDAKIASTDSTKSQTKKKKKKKKKNVISKNIDIDADAIKRAMQNIEFKSQKSFENWTQQKMSSQEKTMDSELSQLSLSNVLKPTKYINSDSFGLTSMSKTPNAKSTQLPTVSEHSIIPSTPLRAFHRDTSASIKATGRLSRSATIAEALSRIFEHQHREGKELTNVKTLNLHIIGADHVECASEKIIQTTFEPLIRWIQNSLNAKNRLFYHPIIDNLHIKLLGPNVPEKAHDTYTETEPLVLSSYSSNPTKEGGTTTVVCQRCCYHDYLDELESKTGGKMKDVSSKMITLNGEMIVVLAFNAGIYGYNEWIPTLKRMLSFQKQILPFVITSYTLEEAEDDAEVIQDVLQLKNTDSNDNDKEESSESDKILGKCLWDVEINPFTSKVERRTTTAIGGRKYYENRAWQAYLLGVDLSDMNNKVVIS